jgi:hypothetical protein
MTMHAALLLTALLVACAPDTRLEELRGATLAFKLSANEFQPAPHFSLFVWPEVRGDGERKHDGRRKLSTSAKASFNGQPLKRLTGIYAMGDLSYDRDRILEFAFPGNFTSDRGGPLIELGGPIPAPARATAAGTVRIEDGSAIWTLSVPDAFTPRTLTLESPSGPTPKLQRGERVVLRWAPATDVLSGKDMRLRLQQPGRPLDGVIIGSDALTIEGGRLSFTVPSDVPAAFTGPIQLQLLAMSPFEPKRSTCPVAKCEVEIAFSIDAVSAILR